MSRYIKVLNEDGTFTEKKVYWEEDMDSFAEWVDANAFRPNLRDWYVMCDGEPTTITQLRGLWEDWKLAQQRGEELK